MKKLLAILVCMFFVVSILPLSAMAVTRPSEIGSEYVYIDEKGGDSSIRSYSHIWGYTSGGSLGSCYVTCEVEISHGSQDKALARFWSNVRTDLTVSVGSKIYYTDSDTGNESIYTSGIEHSIRDDGFTVTATAPNAYSYEALGAFVAEFDLYGDWYGATTQVV